MENKEHIINIDKEKCVGCKQCVRDCPEKNVFIGDDGKAQVRAQTCMKCGHCVAVCPMEAVKISGFSESPIDLNQLGKVDSEALMGAIKSRRSIRQFTGEAVAEEDVKKIIEAGRWTPTGKNSQGVRYIILDEEKANLEALAVKVFKRLLKVLNLVNKSYSHITIDDNFFFKKAPLVIVVAADNSVNGSLAAGNMALMAESLGLGVLYSGFFTMAAKLSSKIRKVLGIRKKELVMTLVIGHPAVKYRRTAQKDEAVVIRK